MIFIVTRERLGLLLSAGLLAFGAFAAHDLSYTIVAGSRDRATLLDATGHGYLDHLPVLLAVGLALLPIVLLTQAVNANRPFTVPAWLFVLLPPVGFAVQEHVERLIESGVFPASAALEPTFLLGLMLQLPFAGAALLIARVLLRVSAHVGRRLTARQLQPLSRALVGATLPVESYPTRYRVLAAHLAGRAPPATASA